MQKRFLSKWRKLNWLLFLTTVLLKAMFTLLIYSIDPLTTEGYWCFFLFCLFVFYFVCVFEAVASIFGHNVFVYLMWWRKDKKNLPRCVLNQMFVFLSCFCVVFLLKMKNQVHEGFLFIWQAFFGLIIMPTCNMWLHAALVLTKGVCPLQKHQRGLCTRPRRMILMPTECHWGEMKRELALYKLPAEE